MACNTCSKSFSLLRPEKGCPSCGFSYCSKCLSNKIFLQKINSEAKVCLKCSKIATSGSNETNKIIPPDAYYKRIGAINTQINKDSIYENSAEKEIYERLQKLKEQNEQPKEISNNDDITSRLGKLKGDVPSTSDVEIAARLANLKGVPVGAVQSKPILLPPDTRTEQEQADDLIKQYMEKTNIDTKYKEDFDGVVTDIENRLQKLKGASNVRQETEATSHTNPCDNDEELLKKIIEEAKTKVSLEENELCYDTSLEELPFCEICNEDAKMRCLGCKYLFCKRCFNEHKDDDYGCDRYEPYTAPKAV